MRVPEVLSDPVYHDEDAARTFLEEARWPEAVFCPLCGSLDKISRLGVTGGKRGGQSMGPGWWYCGACRGKFTVRVGTIFERSHIPLHKWLLAIRLLSSSKKGISSHQLHRTLGVTYKSAWFLSHRIREMMTDGNPSPLGGEGKTVEADETYVNKQRGRAQWSFSNEEGRWVKERDRRSLPVFALVERGGGARAMPIAGATSDELRRALKKHADTKSALMTDDWSAYMRPGREFTSHGSVNHSEEEWTRWENGKMVGTQAVENFFSVFKRGMRDVYQHCSDEHLARYLQEFAFRYSHRAALGVDDAERTGRVIQGAEGKRLTYRRARSQQTTDEIPF
jgi:transposase-like protein